jgi:hypothetical protein
MHYICDIEESDFPCKFFVLIMGPDATVRMTRLKHINTYLNDIEPISIAPVCKYNNFFKFVNDEEPDIDMDSTDGFPRMVK